MESILISVKKALGVEIEYDGFDAEIILCINTAIMSLDQLGVGQSKNFRVLNSLETWEQLLGAINNLEAAKTYVCQKVRLFFDPPATSFVLEAINRQITELEWRLAIQAEQT
jgi:hypothetical protein